MSTEQPPLIKEGTNKYRIEQTGTMNVPAIIYSSDALLELITNDSSLTQSKNVASLPGIVKASFTMPDMHQGYGFPIGGVAAFDVETGIITPGGIGFDINCGVRLMKTPLTETQARAHIQELLDSILKAVPVGIGTNSDLKLSSGELDDILQNGCSVLRGWDGIYGSDITRCEEKGSFAQADPHAVSQKAKARGKAQLGTLGAGNHFIGIQIVDHIYDRQAAQVMGLKEDQVLYMIHCGSRGLGHQVCSDYLREIEKAYPNIASSLPEKDLMYAPFHSDIGKKYYHAMAAAANFAWSNRLVIAARIRKAIADQFSIEPERIETIYDVAHNIAKPETHIINGQERKLIVHRKGATRAFPPGHPDVPDIYKSIGQPVLIPGSMGTYSYILTGTEESMQEAFGSAPHGAGRRLSRKRAMEEFNSQQIRDELQQKNITLVSTTDKGIMQEAPGAYKDIDEVIAITKEAGLAKPVIRLRSLGVVKG